MMRTAQLLITATALSCMAGLWGLPAAAQFDDDDFFDRGRDRLEEEIDRLQNGTPEIDLGIDAPRPAADWHQLVVTEGAHFTVVVPGPPQTYDEVAIATPEGDLNFVGWLAVHEGSQFIVAYSEYPTSTPEPAKRLTDLRDRMVEDTSWTLTDDISTPLDVYPGRSFTLFNAEHLISYRFYLVEQQLYILGVVQPPDGGVEPEADAFFDSFKLLPPDVTVEDLLPPGSVPVDEE